MGVERRSGENVEGEREKGKERGKEGKAVYQTD
jgi:hypothetical protein